MNEYSFRLVFLALMIMGGDNSVHADLLQQRQCRLSTYGIARLGIEAEAEH